MSAWIVSFINGKGGVGKTTLASALAVEMARTGKHVIGADLEQDHTPFRAWAENRKRNGHVPEIEVRKASHATVMELAAFCDLLVIDTAGWADTASVALAEASHLSVIPMNSITHSGPVTVRLLHNLKLAEVPDFKLAIALNGVTGLPAVTECKAYLKLANYEHLLLPGYVRHLRTYEAASRDGLAINEVGREVQDELQPLVKGMLSRLRASGQQITRELAERAAAHEPQRSKGRGR